jgi:cation transport regulator ChaB
MPPSTPALRRAVFEDGFGKRHHAKAPSGELLEVLELRQELATDGFEVALRERVTALAGLQSTWFSHVRTVQRIKQKGAALFVVYDRVPGTRLSSVLGTRPPSAPLELNATLYLIRQLAAAVALLHEKLPAIAHGAISAERVIITPDARVVVADHVFGSALEQLQYSPGQYWNELHVALPGGPPAFDQRVDVMQIGTLALELILGRRIESSEYPAQLEDLTEHAWRIRDEAADSQLPLEFRAWLLRMLQFDPRHAFPSAVDAWADLEDMLGARDYGASFVALEAVMADYAKTTAAADAVTSTEPSAAARLDAVPPATEAAAPLPADPSPVTLDAVTRVPDELDAPASIQEPDRTAPPSTSVPLPSAVSPSSWQALAATPGLTSERELAPAELYAAPAGFGTATVDESDRSDPSPATRNRKWMAVAAVLVLLAAGGAMFGRQYLLPSAAAEAPGTLVVTTNPPGYQVFIDGQPRGVTPLTVELAPGAHELKIATEGEPRIIPFTVAAGSTVAQTIEVPKAAPVTGQLMVHTEPAGARVMIDNTLRGITPLTIEGLTPGTLSVTLQNDLSSVTQDVTIEPGVRASLVVPMTPPQGVPISGWLSVVAPAEVQVYEGGRLLGTSASDRIMVSAGPHTLEIVNEPLGYRLQRSVTVTPGKVSPVRLEWPNGTMALNAQPWAEVWVNGKPLGETPIGSVTVPIGTHEVVFRHPDLGEQVVRATVTAKAPARVTVDLRKK